MATPVSIALVIREDPRLTHRPVEALRIALGLAAGDNPITVILLGQAVQLLAEETDDLVDVEILEKYLPSFQHLAIPFLLLPPEGSSPDIQDGFAVTIGSNDAVHRTLAEAERVLVF